MSAYVFCHLIETLWNILPDGIKSSESVSSSELQVIKYPFSQNVGQEHFFGEFLFFC